MNRFLSYSSLSCHTILHEESGAYFGWGNNDSGSIGCGNLSHQNAPVTVTLDPTHGEIEKLASGWNHNLAIMSDGTLLAWGANGLGQLGIGKTESYADVPRLLTLPSDSPVVEIACGRDFSLAVTEDGSLFTWGENGDGQLGYEGNTQYTPRLVDTLPNVEKVSAGRDHVFARTKDGKYFSWGYNMQSQLGLNHRKSLSVPEPFPLSEKFTEIICGGFHTIGITKKGRMWGWGSNEHGRLGTGIHEYSLPPGKIPGLLVQKVVCGLSSSHALSVDGKLYSWGDNSYSQLGTSNKEPSRVPIQISIPGDVASIFCGCVHVGAITKKGELYIWGNAGRLGIGDRMSAVPTLVENKKWRLPCGKHWQRVFTWVFLGHKDCKSIFSELPIEVIFHMVSCLP
jgi:hypothetical protein